MTKTRPTPKKLPRDRTFVADYDASHPAEVRFETYDTVADQRDNRPDLQPFHVAFIPTHTAAQAKRIVKAAPFLQMTEEEQAGVLGHAYAEFTRDGPEVKGTLGRYLLRAMTQPKGRGET